MHSRTASALALICRSFFSLSMSSFMGVSWGSLITLPKVFSKLVFLLPVMEFVLLKRFSVFSSSMKTSFSLPVLLVLYSIRHEDDNVHCWTVPFVCKGFLSWSWLRMSDRIKYPGRVGVDLRHMPWSITSKVFVIRRQYLFPYSPPFLWSTKIQYDHIFPIRG